MMKRFFTIMMVLTMALTVMGQNERLQQERLMKAYRDSLAMMKQKLDSMQEVNDSLQEVNYVRSASKYYRLFAPMTYYPSVTQGMIGMRENQGMRDMQHMALAHVYLSRPNQVRYNARKLQQLAKEQQMVDDYAPEGMVQQIPHSAAEATEKPMVEQPMDLVITKPHFWTFSGDYYLQFLQTYVSPNWYKSGESTYSMVAGVTVQYNYNNKQRVKWDNKLELKLGFLSTEADSINKFKTSDDLIRYTSKLGFRAAKQWYYTGQVIASTQFTRGLKNNDKTIYSDFLSPLTVNLSIGMDYVIDSKNKQWKGNVHIAPLAYNMKYVDRINLAERFGIAADHHAKHDIGPMLLTEVTWTPNDMLKWQTRLYAYTTFKRCEMEFENTLTFKLNKYISAMLFVYPRFDDSEERADKYGYWQFKEHLSVGFAYSM